jgi:DNA-directed RNA polymerase specialized sigma24 family protein
MLEGAATTRHDNDPRPGNRIPAVLAARIDDMGAALAALDPGSRALLDLSMRRGLADDEIGDVLHVGPEEVARRREHVIEELARELGIDGREQRDEVFASLPDLPERFWRGQAARA